MVRFDRIAPVGSYRWVTGGAYAGVDAVPGREAELGSALTATHDHMRCWPKAGLPAHLPDGRNPRVPAFVCLADVGWVIADGETGGERGDGGTHGYDNQAPEMWALFIAEGPDLARGRIIDDLSNTEVQPLLGRLLGLVPTRPLPSPIVRAERD